VDERERRPGKKLSSRKGTIVAKSRRQSTLFEDGDTEKKAKGKEGQREREGGKRIHVLPSFFISKAFTPV
jgi:hypothetical protein